MSVNRQNQEPLVSVVMAVYNEANCLAATINSILDQSYKNLEFIIVNDGSNDGSAELLAEFSAKDARVIVLSQSNSGITQALINGCARAQGKYIARQDAGDLSLPTRLARQVEQIQSLSNLVMSSVGTQFIAPDGEVFNEFIQTSQQADQGLRNWRSGRIVGPSHHGAVMFCRQSYLSAGGYRAEFKVAQDIDLWSRLIEFGQHATIEQSLYHAYSRIGSISSQRRQQQQAMAALIVQCCRARAETGSDEAELQKAIELNQALRANSSDTANSRSNFYYFIASNLANKDRPAARKYLKLSWQANRFNWKALIKLAIL